MKKALEIQRKRTSNFQDKENEILHSFNKINDLIEMLDTKMKESLTTQEKSLMVSFDKVFNLIMKDMKVLKENYAEALHNFEINPNIMKLKKEVLFLKNQLNHMNDENGLLKKIISNYKQNVSYIKDDRNFEKKIVLETQRENTYLKITLDEISKENSKKQESFKEKQNKELLNSFIFNKNKTFEENFIILIKNEEISTEEKILDFHKNFEILTKQHSSEIQNYKHEVCILRTKFASLTQTNYKMFSKINGVSKIEKLFNDSIEALKEKILLRKEKSKSISFGPSNLQTTINNSNISKISDLMNGIDTQNFTKFDKIELISTFLSSEKFVNFLKELTSQKKCCLHQDCFFNAHNFDFPQEDQQKVKLTKFSQFCEEIKKRKFNPPNNRTDLMINNTDRTHSQPKQEERKHYLVLTSRENEANQEKNVSMLSPFKGKEILVRKDVKSKSSWMNKELITKSIDMTKKSDDKFYLFLRKRHFKKKTMTDNENTQSVSSNQIKQSSKNTFDESKKNENQDEIFLNLNEISFS